MVCDVPRGATAVGAKNFSPPKAPRFLRSIRLVHYPAGAEDVYFSLLLLFLLENVLYFCETTN